MKNNPLKKTVIAKGIGEFSLDSTIRKSHVPKAGDLAIFKVLAIGKHNAVQGLNGNNCYIFPNDLLLAAFGNRYATEQFEGYVPLKYHPEYHILGKGGAVGILASMHEKLELAGPTTLQLIGYAVSADGTVLNTKYFGQEELGFQPLKRRPYKVVLSLGASMDSGKTTSAGFVCRGLRQAGQKAAYIKLTGTVYTKDTHFVRDCGAAIAVDFSKFGFPSTYMCSTTELLNLYESLLQKVSVVHPDYVVVEIADGLFQRETRMLLTHQAFMRTVSYVIYSAPESLSALNGVSILNEYGIRPFALSGLFTTSPLLREEVINQTGISVKHISELGEASVLGLITATPAFYMSKQNHQKRANGKLIRLPSASAI